MIKPLENIRPLTSKTPFLEVIEDNVQGLFLFLINRLANSTY
jgi:hypothetical protein